MTIPLCLLADSPMAAEFTKTPIPGSSNNPCQICHLHCPQGDVRSTMTYMQEFFGHPQLPTDRKWCETITRTKELWKISQEKTNKSFERKHKEYGLRDRINFALIDIKNQRYDERVRIIQLIKEEPTRIYNPLLHLKCFDGCKDTPVEVLHVVLLGIVKYLTTHFMNKLSTSQMSELEARWWAFNSEGLSLTQYNPNTWLHIMAVLLAKNTE